MRISAYTAPEDVPVKEWDSLTEGDTIYSTSGWLWVRRGRQPEGTQGHYLLARDENDTAVAGLETYAFVRPPRPLYHPAPLLAGLVDDEQLDLVGQRPLTIATGWQEYRGQIPGLAGLDPADREAAVAALGAHAIGIAEDFEASMVGYFYLPREHALEVLRAHSDAAPVALLHDVETAFPVGQWQDFDEYVAWLPSGRRKRARREVRDFRQSGRTIRSVGLPEVVDTIAPLNSQLMRKHGHAFSPERAAGIYGLQAQFLGEASTVLLAEDAGRVIGFALRYRLDDMLYARVAGFDYSVPNQADYFNLVFYHQLEQQAAQPTRGIHLGVNTLQAKLTRGAQPTPLYTVLVGVRQPLKVSADAVRARNLRVFTEFEERHGRDVVGGVNAADWLL